MIRRQTVQDSGGEPEQSGDTKQKTPVRVKSDGSFAKLFSKKAFFALHYGQSRALRASLAQSHT